MNAIILPGNPPGVGKIGVLQRHRQIRRSTKETGGARRSDWIGLGLCAECNDEESNKKSGKT